MAVVLQVNNISKTYGSRGNTYTALHDLSFDITEGEFVGIMGPSGSGKTTLLNLVATIDQPTNGKIFIDGQSILGMKEAQLAAFRRDKLGFIFQDFNLLDTLTLRENIELPLALADEPTGALDSKSANELLECMTELNVQRQATIMMVTHDPFAASYCSRVLFIKDGRWFTELVKGGTRKEFYQKIIDTLSVMGGGQHERV